MTVELLIEEYNRKLKTINNLLVNYLHLPKDHVEKLNTKASCYRTFITELERI